MVVELNSSFLGGGGGDYCNKSGSWGIMDKAWADSVSLSLHTGRGPIQSNHEQSRAMQQQNKPNQTKRTDRPRPERRGRANQSARGQARRARPYDTPERFNALKLIIRLLKIVIRIS
jgi:hypothetical protein